MTRHEQQEFARVLRAHLDTVAVCDACAGTTRDLAIEVARGGKPPREDLARTAEEAERVLRDLDSVRSALQDALARLGDA